MPALPACVAIASSAVEDEVAFASSGSLVGGSVYGGAKLLHMCSFSADTPVLLADGKTKRFSDLQPGDEVLATDPLSQEQGARAIQAIWVHNDDLYELYIDGQRIITTEDHPFWDETDHRWEGADQLDRGDLVRTPTGVARVTAFKAAAHRYAAAYNLTVDDLHTYYVMAGETPVLVHNTGGCGTGLKNSSDGLKRLFSDGSVRGKSIIDIRSQLVDDGFSQGLTKNKKGYLFQNGTGEEVRIMRRGGGWDVRVRNADGNHLDEFGNVANPADTHDIEVYSR